MLKNTTHNPGPIENTVRFSQLQTWAQTQLTDPIEQVTALAKNAGFRRYFRLNLANATSVLAVDSPSDSDNNTGFIELSRTLSQLGLRVPKVIATHVSQGFLLVDDLGDNTFENALATTNVDSLYQRALTTLVSLQTQAKHPLLRALPTFDKLSMQQQLTHCQTWFLEKLLHLTLDDHAQSQLNALFNSVISHLGAQPKSIMHADYQCRNLMVLANQDIALLDFQHASHGAAAYDVASLLWDCYLDWPADKTQQWLLFYYNLACEKQVITPVGMDTFTDWFYWAALQRHLKNVFIFARKYLRDDEPIYLTYLPRTLGYVINALAQCKNLHKDYQWWQTVVVPALDEKLKNLTQQGII